MTWTWPPFVLKILTQHHGIDVFRVHILCVVLSQTIKQLAEYLEVEKLPSKGALYNEHTYLFLLKVMMSKIFLIITPSSGVAVYNSKKRRGPIFLSFSSVAAFIAAACNKH